MLFLHKFLNSAKNDERGVWGSARLPRPDAGAPEPTRTADTRFRKPLLYPLSYGGTAGKCTTPWQPAQRRLEGLVMHIACLLDHSRGVLKKVGLPLLTSMNCATPRPP